MKNGFSFWNVSNVSSHICPIFLTVFLHARCLWCSSTLFSNANRSHSQRYTLYGSVSRTRSLYIFFLWINAPCNREANVRWKCFFDDCGHCRCKSNRSESVGEYRTDDSDLSTRETIETLMQSNRENEDEHQRGHANEDNEDEHALPLKSFLGDQSMCLNRLIKN